MTDDNDELRKPQAPVRSSKKSIAAMLQRVARPTLRSPLFWWLIDHHDELRQAQVNTGRGITWKSLCEDFPDQGVTLADGRPVTPHRAKLTWQRVRKEIVRVEERRALELAERDARRAADPRRNMPSRFPKGDYGPPLATHQPQAAPSGARALALTKGRLTRDEERDRGLQLSTAEGVVVTEISRVYKLPGTVEDFEFYENGIIRGRQGYSSVLKSKQEMNKRSGRRINDDTADWYANCGLRMEEL